jgi:1,4-dihydroxy-2-naphthoate octaprenyltransferase
LSGARDAWLATHAAGRARLWILAARPRTLTISVAPVLAATAHAWAATRQIAWTPVLAALVASIAIQIATNLFNDAADGARGHDGPGRLGPQRVTASGLIPAVEVARAALLSVAVAGLAGLVATAYGGWPILAVGVLSLIAGWGYSNGPAPISASPMGEIFVVAFFGVAAVTGVAYLADPASVTLSTFALGVALGLPAAATLTVNNHRDRVEDARNGRRTLAILIGERGATILYAGLLIGAAALFTALAVAVGGGFGALAGAGAVAGAAALARRFALTPVGRGLNAMIARTAAYELALAGLYAAAAVWGAAR